MRLDTSPLFAQYNIQYILICTIIKFTLNLNINELLYFLYIKMKL